MSEVVGSARVTIDADTTGFERQLASGVASAASKAGTAITRGLGKAAGAVTSTLNTGLKAAAVATGALTVATIKSGVEYNRLGQRATAALTTLLGNRDAAREMISDLTEFAKTSPFPRQAFIAGTQQMIGFGFEAERVIPTLDAIQNAVAAIGGGAQDIEEIIDVFSRIQGQGKITGAELNRLGIRGINAAKLIADAMGETEEAIRKKISAGALDAETALTALTDAMQERFGGAAEGLKDTFEGARDRVLGAIRDIGSALVEPFIGFEEGGAFVGILNRIADALRAFEKGPLLSVQYLLEGFAEKMGKAFGRGLEVVRSLKGEGEGLAASLQGLGPAIAAVGAGLGVSLASSLPVIGSLFAGLNPIVVAIGVLIAAVPELREVFIDTFLQMFEAVQPLLPVIADLVRALLEGLTPVLGAVIGVLGNLVEALAPVISGVLKALTPALGTLGDALAVIIEAIGDSLITLLDALAPVLPVLAEAFADIAVSVAEVLTELAPLLPVLTELIVAILEPLIPLLLMLFEMWMRNAQIALPILVGAIKVVTAVLTVVMNLISGPLNAVLNVLVSVLDVVTRAFDVVARAVDGLVGWVGSLSSGISTVIGWISRAVGWLGRLGNAILDVARKIPLLGSLIPGSLPPLALGVKLTSEAMAGLTRELSKVSGAISVSGPRLDLAPFVLPQQAPSSRSGSRRDEGLSERLVRAPASSSTSITQTFILPTSDPDAIARAASFEMARESRR